MTPTPAQVEAERERAHALGLGFRCQGPAWEGEHTKDCTRTATALAARAIEARDEALREAADTVHAGALAADKEAGGALASLCLSLAEHAIRGLRKP